MSQVLSSFLRGVPGAVSRSADAVIVSLPNAGDAPIPPGAPVFLSADGSGVTLAQADSAFGRFAGIAVRIPSRAPEVYGANTAPYAGNDPVDILVRGAVVVSLKNEACEPGGAVWLTLADGSFTTEETENETIRLANCSWRRSADIGDGCAELVILSRNLI